MIDFVRGLFTNQFLYGAASSLLATFIAWGCGQLYFICKNKSMYSGTWKVQIFDEEMNVVKEDIMKFRHNSNTGILKGQIKRLHPSDQAGKSLSIIGVLKDRQLLSISYANEPIQQMAAVHSVLEGDYYFKGSYLRYNLKTKEVERIPISFKKMRKGE